MGVAECICIGTWRGQQSWGEVCGYSSLEEIWFSSSPRWAVVDPVLSTTFLHEDYVILYCKTAVLLTGHYTDVSKQAGVLCKHIHSAYLPLLFVPIPLCKFVILIVLCCSSSFDLMSCSDLRRLSISGYQTGVSYLRLAFLHPKSCISVVVWQWNGSDNCL